MTTIFSIKDSDISTENLVTKKIMSAIDGASKGTWDFKEMDTVASGQALHGRLSLTPKDVTTIADKLGESIKEETPQGTIKYVRPLRNCKPGFAFLSTLNAMSEEERASLRMKWEATNSNRRLNSLKLYKLHKGEKEKAPTKLELIKLAFEDSLEPTKNKAGLDRRLHVFHASVAEILEHDFAKKDTKETTKKTTKK
tara:strand:- start:91 stop:681 length:591 start_codon:yes stop_codon:yes gene_type:complete